MSAACLATRDPPCVGTCPDDLLALTPHCPQAITVGGTPFRFNALPEDAACDVLSLPPATPGGGTTTGGALVGAVRQKLMVLRNIEDERERVRARAEEAERRGHERKALLLDGRPAAAGKRRPTTTTVQRPTPPPPGAMAAQQQQRQRGPTPPPQQLTASMLAPAQPPAARPPTHPASAQQRQRARSATPPPTTGGAAAAPGPAAGKPMHKSASTSRLGGKQQGAAGGGAAAKQPASALVLQAARSGAGLRLVLIAMLSERQMGPAAVKNGEGGTGDVSPRRRSQLCAQHAGCRWCCVLHAPPFPTALPLPPHPAHFTLQPWQRWPPACAASSSLARLSWSGCLRLWQVRRALFCARTWVVQGCACTWAVLGVLNAFAHAQPTLMSL